MAETLKTIPLDRIDMDLGNLRQQYTDIDGLADSISFVGILEPPVVTKDGDRYKLVAGHRRYLACQELVNRKEWTPDQAVKCILRTGLDETQRTASMLIENMQRVDLDPVEQAIGVFALTSLHAMSEADVAHNLGVSKQWVKDRVAIASLDADLQEAVADGRFRPLSAVVAFAHLSSDRQEHLRGKDGTKIPGQWDIEAQASKEASQDRALKLERKLRKMGVMVTTEPTIKKIAASEYGDLVEDADFMSIKSALGAAEKFPENRWTPAPGTWLTSTSIGQYHRPSDDAVLDYVKEHGKGIILVMAKVQGFVDWQHWDKLEVNEDGGSEDMTDYDRAELDNDARNAKKREAYDAKLFRAQVKIIETTKPAELLRMATTYHIMDATAYRDTQEICTMLDIGIAPESDNKRADQEVQRQLLYEFMLKNAANLAKTAAAVCLCSRGGAEALGLKTPPKPEYGMVDMEQYDDEGAYIHPSDEAEESE